MSPASSIVEWPARTVINTVRALSQRRNLVAFCGLILTLVVGLAYVIIVGLRVNPAQEHITVRVVLPQSGGLLANQDVTLRGVPIGRVESVAITGKDVTALAEINADVKIPQDTTARVSALTAAGEQYLDFRPTSDHGPYLADGATIGREKTAVPVSFAQLLDHAEGALNQVEPEKVSAIMKELRVGPDGPRKLTAIVDGGTFLITTLDSVLPQTVSLIKNTRAVLTTVADTRAGLRDTAEDLKQILGGVNRMDNGFRRFVDTGTKPLTQLDGLISDNSDTMVALLGNLTTVAQLSYLRVPALQALFPTTRDSMLANLSTAIHDGGAWAIGDPYPRYSCDYNLPRHSPSQADYPEPYLYTYCGNPDPSVLIRGARNAPRPLGDDTAGPPPGYNPLATTDPTPSGPLTIPLPYGGPPLPYAPPN